MKLYKTTITPLSNFSTSLKGDTLFGQMCWAIRFGLGEDRLKELLEDYESNPFLVVSDAFASGYMPKPTMPSSFLNENNDDKKENRKKIWLSLEQLQDGKFENAKTNNDIKNNDKKELTIKNSINYKTSNTGDGFDPYDLGEEKITPKDIYFLINDSFSLDEAYSSFGFLSQMGYGKKTSIGKGRFTFSDFELLELNNNSKTFMAISPFTPNKIKCKDIFYEPFTRFGKLGGDRANTNAFKKPILLADSGAIINYDSSQNIQYVGKEIKNISSYEDVRHQGYAILIAIKDL